MTRGKNFDILTAFLDGHGLRYQTHPTEPVVMMGMTGSSGSWQCLLHCDDQRARFALFSKAPVAVAAGARPAAAEFITRANYGLVIGNFEMDYDDGEVRYKTSMDIDGISLNDRLLMATMAVNFQMMDKYMPGLMAVCYGNASPEEAVRKIESRPSDAEVEAVVRRLIESAVSESIPESVAD